MIVFEWEKSVIEVARTWPVQGAIFEFFKFWTDYKESFWLVLIVIVYLIYKYGLKKMLIPFVFTLGAVLIADFTSRRLIKFFVMRPRPNFIDTTCEISKCWGFVSSHSTNVAAAATFLILYNRKNIYWALPCTLLVGFSRIYLVDHFPLDVIGGFFIGMAVGIIIFLIYKTQKIQIFFRSKN